MKSGKCAEHLLKYIFVIYIGIWWPFITTRLIPHFLLMRLHFLVSVKGCALWSSFAQGYLIWLINIVAYIVFQWEKCSCGYSLPYVFHQYWQDLELDLNPKPLNSKLITLPLSNHTSFLNNFVHKIVKFSEDIDLGKFTRKSSAVN